MSANFPRISVVVPSYNQSVFLEQTLQSILYQNYPNLELIVMDGGSTDGSVDVIRKYEKQIHYWVSEKDNGQVAAINKGMKIATGDWLAFQNSDDLFIGSPFFALAKAIGQYPAEELFYGDLFIIDEQSRFKRFQLTVSFEIAYQWSVCHQIHNQSMFFKRVVLEKVGMFDENFRFSFDFDFVFKLADKGIKTRHLPTMYGAFRHHAQAKSSTIVDVSTRENERIFQQFAGNLQLEAVNKKTTRWKYYLDKFWNMTLEPGWPAYFWKLKNYYESELRRITSFEIH